MNEELLFDACIEEKFLVHQFTSAKNHFQSLNEIKYVLLANISRQQTDFQPSQSEQ